MKLNIIEAKPEWVSALDSITDMIRQSYHSKNPELIRQVILALSTLKDHLAVLTNLESSLREAERWSQELGG